MGQAVTYGYKKRKDGDVNAKQNEVLRLLRWHSIGGFRLGMEAAGHECVGFCEYDEHAVASYTSMHLITDEQREYLATLPMNKRKKEILKEEYRNGEWYAKDIRHVNGVGLPRADIWCFGAPCQDFSVAGARKGLDGDRSSLVREVFRILAELKEEDRPEWLVYENVKGMLSSNRGRDYLAILMELDELGYDAEWNLINSKDHGVPQNRERVYTVGHLRRCGRSEIFPIEGTDGEDSVPIIRIGHANNFRRYNQVYDSQGAVECLDCGSGGGHNPYVMVSEAIGGVYTNDSPAFHRGISVGISRTLMAEKIDAAVVLRIGEMSDE